MNAMASIFVMKKRRRYIHRKPAALYTNVIAKLKQQTLKPIAAYHISGEYAG